MRMPNEGEDLTWKVCVCSVGRPAIVTHATQFCVSRGSRDSDYKPTYVPAWAGLGLDGKGTWVSTNPCVIAESGKEFHDKLITRFEGRMLRNV